MVCCSLTEDRSLSSRLWITNSIVSSKLINKIKPGAIPANRIVTKKTANTFEVLNNHSLAISGAKELGCQVINIGANDLAAGTVRVDLRACAGTTPLTLLVALQPHLVLGLLWQVIKVRSGH